MVLPDSYEVSRASKYSGPPLNEPEKFYLRGYHPLWPAFPGRSTIFLVGNSSATPYCRLVKTYNPEHTTHTGLAYVRFGCSLFARRYWGNRACFLLLQVLRCFTSLSGPRTPMDSAHDTTAFPVVSCLIRVSSGHGLLAARRGLSQLATPFIAS